MKPVVGHEANLAVLKTGLPPVSLFIGPHSVGKRYVAEFLRQFYGIAASDTARVHKLTVHAARGLVEFAQTYPQFPQGKLAVVQLDGASPAAQNALLKTLEAASDLTRFILIAATEPLPTIVSRAQVFEFGLLTSSDVSLILSTHRGFKEHEANHLALLSGGQLSRALEALVRSDEKNTVLLCIKAFREHSEPTLASLTERWTDDTTELLTIWCHEQVTQHWRFFSDDETGIEGKALALKILMAIDHDIRPRLLVRGTLMSLLRSMK